MWSTTDETKRTGQTPEVSRAFKPESHLNRQIPPEPHTAMYVWHKYWSRKTWNVVGEFIKTYTRENDIVFDPFAGSGVVAIEAARNRRRAIVCDLNPVASMITELTLRPVNLTALYQAFERVRERVQKKIEKLYKVHCVKCGALVAACFVREGDEVAKSAIPAARLRAPVRDRLQPKKDIAALKAWRRSGSRSGIRRTSSTTTVSRSRRSSTTIPSTNSSPAQSPGGGVALRGDPGREEPATAQVPDGRVHVHDSSVHADDAGVQSAAEQPLHAFSSPGWTQHSLLVGAAFHGTERVDTFESAVTGHQGLINAKEESAPELPQVKLTDDWEQVLAGKADIAVVTADCLEVMEKMPEESRGLRLHRSAVRRLDSVRRTVVPLERLAQGGFRYTERLVTHEIVRNERQKKPFEVYHALLSNSFQGFLQGPAEGPLPDADVSQPHVPGPQRDRARGQLRGLRLPADSSSAAGPGLRQGHAPALWQRAGRFLPSLSETQREAIAADGGGDRGAFPPHRDRDLPGGDRRARRTHALHDPHQLRGPEAGEDGALRHAPDRIGRQDRAPGRRWARSSSW